MTDSFLGVLASSGRAAEIPAEADLYGWLVGSWDLDVLQYWVDLRDRGVKAEAHFGWVLEGRAIQDVWVMPPRSARGGPIDTKMNTYGTTLRVWDAALQAWRITWINPVSGHVQQQIGRRVGNDIVQLGARADGTPTRWRFTEITADSFHWLGESLQPDGQTWKLEGEYRGRRVR